MISMDGYRKDIKKFCCEQCRMMKPTCDVCKERNAEIARLTEENGKLKEETLKREKRLEQIVKEQRDTIVLFEKSLAAAEKRERELREKVK